MCLVQVNTRDYRAGAGGEGGGGMVLFRKVFPLAGPIFQEQEEIPHTIARFHF